MQFHNLIFVLSAVLLSQVLGCIHLSVAESWADSTFSGWLTENNREVCRMDKNYDFWQIEFFSCEDGKAAFMTPEGDKLYFGNGVATGLLMSQAPDRSTLKVIRGIQWDGKWFC